MELINKTKTVHSFKDYVRLSEEVCKINKFTKIQFNMSSILVLKRIENFEIEFFIKHRKNGLACMIFEQMLALPVKKSWNILGKELVMLLKSWLNSMRTQIISKKENWWIFMKRILSFIEDIRQKDMSMPNVLAEHLTDRLLDLATQDQPNVWQKFEILHCLNLYSSVCKKEIRLALRSMYEEYFIKLSTYMANCGHVPCQITVLETLLRWLVPRNDSALRVSSANKWFSNQMYSKRCVDLFLQKTWMNFHQDARDFFNIHNGASDMVVSVVCKKLTIGPSEITSAIGTQQLWIDVNITTSCVTLILLPSVLQTLGNITQFCFETLVFRKENTERVALLRESFETILSIKTASPPLMEPSLRKLTQEDCNIAVVLGPMNNLKRLDVALKNVFSGKYQINFVPNTDVQLQPQNKPNANNAIQNTYYANKTKFPHAAPSPRRLRKGVASCNRNALSSKSPSSVSTSSLALLRAKVAAYPEFSFDKKIFKVSEEPDFSRVLELDESGQNSGVTVKFSDYGVRICKYSRESKSDTELDTTSKPKVNCASPVELDKDKITSCLLVSTIGSTDESIINDTLERVFRNVNYNKDNIADLVIQEALQNNENRKLIDNRAYMSDKINMVQDISENKVKDFGTANNADVIENTPGIECRNRNKNDDKKCTVISKTTSEESHLEDIAPSFVTVRRKRLNSEKNLALEPEHRQIFDENRDYDLLFDRSQVVDSFFNQHISENEDKQVVVSPTLARKVNNSSENSEDFDEELLVNKENIEKVPTTEEFTSLALFNNRTKSSHVNLKDIEDCLYKILDIVCKNFESDMSKELNKGFDTEDEIPLQTLAQNKLDNSYYKKNRVVDLSNQEMSPDNTFRPVENANLKKKKANTKNNLKIRKSNKIKTCKEEIHLHNYASPISGNDIHAPRRKRKLYSPNGEETRDKTPSGDASDEDLQLSKQRERESLKQANTFYKDIENVRKARTRPQRKKRSGPRQVNPPSPKTEQKNLVFDRLKGTVDNSEKPVYVEKDKYDVYNYLSDSDDDDTFNKQKFNMRNMKKPNISTKAPEAKPLKKNNRKRYTKTAKNSTTGPNTVDSIKKLRNRRSVTKKINEPKKGALADEKMREATKEVLNTSISIEKPHTASEEPEFFVIITPEMEFADDTNNEVNKHPAKIKKKYNKSASSLEKNQDPLLDITERTESPLPELYIESDPKPQNKTKDIAVDKLLESISRSCQGEPIVHNDTQNTLMINDNLGDIMPSNFGTAVQEVPDLEEPQTKRKRNKKNNIPNIELGSTQAIEAKSKRFKLNTENSERSVKNLRKQKSKVQNKSKATKTYRKSDIPETDEQCNHSVTSDKVYSDSGNPPTSFANILKTIAPRNLQIEHFDDVMKDCHAQLFDNVQDDLVMDITHSSNREDKCLQTDFNEQRKERSLTPVVSLKRMSPVDMATYLTSSRNLETDDNSIDESNDREKFEYPKRPFSKQLLINLDRTPPEKRRRCLNDRELHVQSSALSLSISESDAELTNIFKIDTRKDKPEVKPSTSKSLKLIYNQHKKSAKDNKSVSNTSIGSVEKRNERLKINEKKSGQVITKSSISPIEYVEDVTFNLNIKKPEENANEPGPESVSGMQIKNMYQSSRQELPVISKPSSISSSRNTNKEDDEMQSIADTDSGNLPESSSSSANVLDSQKPTHDMSGSDESLKHLTDYLKNINNTCNKMLDEMNDETTRKLVHMFTEIEAGRSMQHEQKKKEMKEIEEQLAASLSKIQKQIAVVQKETSKKMQDAVNEWDERHHSFMDGVKECAQKMLMANIKKKNVIVQLLKKDVDAVLVYLEREKR